MDPILHNPGSSPTLTESCRLFSCVFFVFFFQEQLLRCAMHIDIMQHCDTSITDDVSQVCPPSDAGGKKGSW